MSQPFNPERARTLRIIRRIDNSLLKNRNKNLADFDLTAAQSDIIVYLMNNYQEMSEINQLDIQKHLQLSNPTVSGLLNRLEEKGFISRTSSIHDARYNCISPTQKALEMSNGVGWSSTCIPPRMQCSPDFPAPKRKSFTGFFPSFLKTLRRKTRRARKKQNKSTVLQVGEEIRFIICKTNI